MTVRVIISEIRNRMKYLTSKINEVEAECGCLRYSQKYCQYTEKELDQLGTSISKQFRKDYKRIEDKATTYKKEYRVLKEMEYAYRNIVGEY